MNTIVKDISDFVDLLIKHNAFNDYVKYYVAEWGDQEDIITFLKATPKPLWIIAAFWLEGTKEGADFWLNISNSFCSEDDRLDAIKYLRRQLFNNL